MVRGERIRLRREHVADLEERAERADREVKREQRLALAEERARIARGLHDSVGHAINVIVVRAGAAQIRNDPDPARAHAAHEAIEDIARQTANEIDEIVGALRDPDRGSVEPATPLGLAPAPVEPTSTSRSTPSRSIAPSPTRLETRTRGRPPTVGTV